MLEFINIGDTVYYITKDISQKSNNNYIEANVRDKKVIKEFFLLAVS
ncbi:MAG: hypothetical protein HFE59_08540 [Clostridiales bacterium]|nr:hypothetical protein [Clostridiales bacterium]